MKITFFSADPGNHHFIQPIIDKLALKGYECQLLNNWTITDADIYWFDFADNNLIVASQENKEELKSKKVIARLHSVEAYMGFYKQIDWSCVDHLIFVSDHIKRKCADMDYQDCQLHVIHNGVDLDKFTFRAKSVDGAKYTENLNFSYVGNIVPQKGLLTFIHYFSGIKALDSKAEFHLAGLSRLAGREGEYWEHAKKTIGGVFEEGPTEDVNQWLDDKNTHILVQPSYAESFSIIVAEAMAKGIKVAINNFVGADELWPKELIYSNFQEFCGIIENKYESKQYREWVATRYDLNDKVKEVEEIINAN